MIVHDNSITDSFSRTISFSQIRVQSKKSPDTTVELTVKSKTVLSFFKMFNYTFKGHFFCLKKVSFFHIFFFLILIKTLTKYIFYE